MIFFKKQHEEIAIGFLKRVDLLLRHSDKAVLGYSIDDGVETLKLRVAQSIVEVRIEGQMWSEKRPEVPAAPDPNKVAEAQVQDVKEALY